MSRIDTMKRLGFPPETCPACDGDYPEACDHCDDEGTFVQLICDDFEVPELRSDQTLVAYLDVDHWSFVGIESTLEREQEIDFPFKTAFATAAHFQALGFRVEA